MRRSLAAVGGVAALLALAGCAAPPRVAAPSAALPSAALPSAALPPPDARAAMAARLDAGVRRWFAHWDGAPSLDYDSLLEAYRLRVREAATRRALALATLEFLAALGNGHTDLADAPLAAHEGAPLGIELRWLDGAWVVTRSAHAAPRPGDVVAAIDGEPTEAVFQRHRRWLPASSERGARLLFSARGLLFAPAPTFRLADGREVVVARRWPAPAPQGGTAPAVVERRLDGGRVAHVRVPSFAVPGADDAAAAAIRRARGADALVLDVRGNGGGSTPWKLQKALAGARHPWWRERPNLRPPPLVARLASPIVAAAWPVPRWRGPLVVLVDGGCASACEDLLVALGRRQRTRLVGDTTYGSTGQPVTLDLGHGIRARVGARRAAFPDGRPFEGVGVAPDLVVRPTRESLATGRDPALLTALDVARALARGGREGGDGRTDHVAGTASR